MTAPVGSLPSSPAVLAPYVEAGLFGPTEVHLVGTVARLEPAAEPLALLALAVATRAPRLGHVGIELAEVGWRLLDREREDLAGLTWPDPGAWAAVLADSPIVAGPTDHRAEPRRPLVWDGTRVYLQRYYDHESAVVADLTRRSEAGKVGDEPAVVGEVLDRLFPVDAAGEPDLQRLATQVALTERVAVIAGGPGTGKTHTVARLLAAAHQVADAQGRRLEVALAAPTGKAAARMTEAVHRSVDEAEGVGLFDADVATRLRAVDAGTIHRLLGWRPGGRFRHDRLNPLPHDLVVVDETSMVSLPLMARLIQAVRPDARLVLVGDPHQLASVDAGTVLGDLVGPAGEASDGTVHETGSGSGDRGGAREDRGGAAGYGPLAGRVTVLRWVHRFGAETGIAALADAIRQGDDDAVVELLHDRDDLQLVGPHDGPALAAVEGEVADAAARVVGAARRGEIGPGLTAATDLKVLTATRLGSNGLRSWSERIERAVADRVPGLELSRRWYAGRPVLVTANDRLNALANGDTGLTVDHDGALVVAFPIGGNHRLVPTARLGDVDTWWAMTIHKSQGSEFRQVVVALPAVDSPILTRELLYTAVTRGREHITVVADEAAVRAAVRRPVARSSGLRDRIWPPPAP